MTDEEIIHSIRRGNHKAALKELYHYYSVVRQLILKNSGNKQDAEDIYQEALIILCRKVKENDFLLSSSLKTFLFSISRLQWMNELRKRKKEFAKDEVPELAESETEKLTVYLQEEEKFRKAENALRKLGEKCQQLLQLFYSQNKNFREIANALGFSNEKVAKNQKYRCMEKARENYLQS